MKSGGQTPAAKRKIIVYIATSADGYIARPDGSVDLAQSAHAEGWLWHDRFRALDRHDSVGAQDV